MHNYIYSLGRAQLVQDGNGLGAVTKNGKASFPTVSCKPKWRVPRPTWRLSGALFRALLFCWMGPWKQSQIVPKSSCITCFNKYLLN